jgi:tetratricopeptide (TPR) repeat protein
LVGRDLNGALADCNESLRLRPNDGNTLNSRGLVQFKLGAFDTAIDDYSAAVAQNANDADSLYGRGAAKLKKGDAAGGNADIAAAQAIKPDIAIVSAGNGITVDAAGANAAPSTAAAGDCALAETHWKSAEETKTIEVYEDHLKRFPDCPFAGLAGTDRGAQAQVTPTVPSGLAGATPARAQGRQGLLRAWQVAALE